MDFLPVHLRVPAAIASYSLCSGTMLLFNKLAMHYGACREGGVIDPSIEAGRPAVRCADDRLRLASNIQTHPTNPPPDPPTPQCPSPPS